MKSLFTRSAALLGIGISAVLASTVIPTSALAAGFPTANCRVGFNAISTRLCITPVQPATTFETAMVLCRNKLAYVASYGDLRYLSFNTALEGLYNPNGRWIGPDLSADDNALCGNRDITFDGDPDRTNFEGTCNKNDVRAYFCAHDRE
jgi:hypothetical protein